jgi:hypothetical protein
MGRQFGHHSRFGIRADNGRFRGQWMFRPQRAGRGKNGPPGRAVEKRRTAMTNVTSKSTLLDGVRRPSSPEHFFRVTTSRNSP